MYLVFFGNLNSQIMYIKKTQTYTKQIFLFTDIFNLQYIPVRSLVFLTSLKTLQNFPVKNVTYTRVVGSV